MTYYATPLTTLDDVIRQSRLQDANAATPTATVQTTIDSADANTLSYLKVLLNGVSDAMQKALNRRLTPYDETKTFYMRYIRDGGLIYDRDWAMRIFTLNNEGGDDSLEITSLTWVGTAFTSSDYRYALPNSSPNHELVFNHQTTLAALDDFTDSVSIVGTWGYHDNFAAMWLDSGDTVQDNPLSASATSLTVVDADVFETYQLIRIESEYLFISSLNTTTNVLTVERGKNGSTAASHVTSTQIDTFVPMPAVAKECRRLVIRAWFLRNPIGNVVVSNEQIKELVEGEMNLSSIPRLMRTYSI